MWFDLVESVANQISKDIRGHGDSTPTSSWSELYTDRHEGSFEIGAGDLVVFPKGKKAIVDIIEAMNKHYCFEKKHA